MAAARESKKDGSRFICAALVGATTKSGAVVQLRYGDVLTDDISDDSVKLLDSLGYLSGGNPKDDADASSDD